jgi:tetratricopeptide (TPR) repeat protein
MSEAQMRLAMVLAREGKQAEALTYARQAVELQPEDSRGHLVLSLLLERQGQVAEAQAEKDKARKLAKAAGITTPKELLESEAAPESTDASNVQPEAPDGAATPLPADPDSEL